MYLAAAGVGTLVLVNDDTVDLTNLQRQIVHATESVGRAKVESAVETLSRINPGIGFETHRLRLTPENAAGMVAGCDAVVAGSDHFATRYALNDPCLDPGVPLVPGAPSRIAGQLTPLPPTRT